MKTRHKGNQNQRKRKSEIWEKGKKKTRGIRMRGKENKKHGKKQGRKYRKGIRMREKGEQEVRNDKMRRKTNQET